jgi:outer membrane protein assembly factor BamB
MKLNWPCVGRWIVCLSGVGLFSAAGCDWAATSEVTSNVTASASETATQPAAGTRADAAVRPVAASAGDAAWASFLGPHGNGTSTETGLLKTFPEDGPKVLWRTQLGTGYSGLTVAGGRVFTLYGRDGREFFASFDAATGEPLWKIDVHEDFAEGRSPGPRSTPAADGDRVYALGASGDLLCVTAAKGDVVWQYNVVDKFDLRLHDEGISPSPLVEGDRLILTVGKSVYALDKKSGEQVWKSLNESMNHSTPVFATIGGQRQLVVLSGRNLVGLDPKDGRELWRHKQEGVNIATPVVGGNDEIFVGAAYGSGAQLVKVSGDTTEQVYKTSVLSPHTATPILHEGHLYGFDDRPGVFKCIEFATGKEKWNTRKTVKGNIIIADGQIILINEEGELILATATAEGYTATAKARLFRGGLCYTAPTLVQGRLYLRSDREMVCVALKE